MMTNRTVVERASGREMVITRTFEASARRVFEAWTTPDLLKRWWTPKSMGLSLKSCEVDARAGGRYRFEIARGDAPPMVFFGRYTDVIPNARLDWTNEESDEGAVTTVTFEDKGGTTLLTMREIYPSKEALDESFEGMEGAMPETFGQLDALLATPV
jgi:uncharacterized protein YndB with AHSA1/START domain